MPQPPRPATRVSAATSFTEAAGRPASLASRLAWALEHEGHRYPRLTSNASALLKTRVDRRAKVAPASARTTELLDGFGPHLNGSIRANDRGIRNREVSSCGPENLSDHRTGVHGQQGSHQIGANDPRSSSPSGEPYVREAVAAFQERFHEGPSRAWNSASLMQSERRCCSPGDGAAGHLPSPLGAATVRRPH